MTALLEKCKVRLASVDDDLSALLGSMASMRLNHEQILVVDTGERIDGMLVLWDGGHQQVRVDSLQIRPDAPHTTGAKLIQGLMDYCRGKTITDIVFCTSSTEFALKASLRGGLVTAPMFYVHFPVKEE
jgi:hypothetical protein